MKNLTDYMEILETKIELIPEDGVLDDLRSELMTAYEDVKEIATKIQQKLEAMDNVFDDIKELI